MPKPECFAGGYSILFENAVPTPTPVQSLELQIGLWSCKFPDITVSRSQKMSNGLVVFLD